MKQAWVSLQLLRSQIADYQQVKYGDKAIAHLSLDERICPRELLEVCEDLLSMRLRKPWFDIDVQAHLQRAHLEVKDIMGEMAVYTSQADVLAQQQQVSAVRSTRFDELTHS